MDNVKCKAKCLNKRADGECVLALPVYIDEAGKCQDLEECSCIGCSALKYKPREGFTTNQPYCNERSVFIEKGADSCGKPKKGDFENEQGTNRG